MLFQTLQSETVPRKVKSLLEVTYSRLLLALNIYWTKLCYIYCLLSYVFYVCTH